MTAKTTGPIRMAVLNTITDENDEKKIENAGAGTEPGIYVDNSDDYTAVTYDMTPDQFGFKGLGSGNTIGTYYNTLEEAKFAASGICPRCGKVFSGKQAIDDHIKEWASGQK